MMAINYFFRISHVTGINSQIIFILNNPETKTVLPKRIEIRTTKTITCKKIYY